ncbi:MAG: hypothetical protein QOH61_2244 [Chloroflexota bacterium]|jgi:hypothetical protein|nr:hypothetical protein [Chloroflexota bacterium]
MPVLGVATFERFFRVAAAVDVDKNDLKRLDDFLHRKLYDLLLIGQARARASRRDVVQPDDLPITKGLQESIHRFEQLERAWDIELGPILARLATYPPLDLALAEDTEARLPRVAGGLALALGQSFRIVDPQLANPSSEHWERAFRLFNLLL